MCGLPPYAQTTSTKGRRFLEAHTNAQTPPLKMDLIDRIPPARPRWGEFDETEFEEGADAFSAESLYSSWGRGEEFQARFQEVVMRLVVSLGSAKAEYDNKLDEVFRLYRRDALKEPQIILLGYKQTFLYFSKCAADFISEMNKLGKRGVQMMLFDEAVAGELGAYFRSSLFDEETLFKRFKGILANPQRFKRGIKISGACMRAVQDYYTNVGVFVMYAEMEIKQIHRELVRFKIEFDKANPDVAAMMMKTMT